MRNEQINYAAIDAVNDVVLGVGSMAACEEYVRVACVEARYNGAAYTDEDTPVVTAIDDLDTKYTALVAAHCDAHGIGFDGWQVK